MNYEKTLKSDIQPFKLYDNIYFVGSSRVSVHIIDTKDGLVMIDTGYPDMYEQILDSMDELGLNPEDICAIFHSHGHIDHFGCTQKFKELSGAKPYISRIDNDIVNGKLDLSWARELGYDRLPPFDCDVLVENDEKFSFGDVVVRCRLTPGHTYGVLSFFIKIGTADREIVAAMHGGVGFNTLKTDFLTRYKLSFNCREVFRESLHKIADEYVDIVLGNHPQQNDTQGKLQKVLMGESVVDNNEWKRFLNKIEHELDIKIANGI
jgi:metallo-beta-lactamase class B